MPTSTYDLIASNVLGSSAASVTFSSIPATYRDLVLVCNILGASGANAFSSISIRFNGDTGSNYNTVYMRGDGSAATSVSETRSSFGGNVTALTSERALVILQALDYAVTDKHKSVLYRDARAGQRTAASAGRWASTNAVNEISISSALNNYDTGSSFYLYGIVS